MIMRGKQRAAAVHIVQMFQRGPSNRKPVISRRAAPDFIQDHQSAVVGLVQNRGRFHHLDHKGRPSPRQIICRPHTAENLADQPDMCRLGGHKRPNLRQQSDYRVLAQEGGFTGHIRPRHQPNRWSVRARQSAIIRHKGQALPFQRTLHHRMPPALHHKGVAVIHHGRAPIFRHRQIGQCCRQIQLRQPPRRRRNRRCLRQNRSPQRHKMRLFLL